MRCFAFKSYQQCLKLVNPGKGSLTDKAVFIYVMVIVPLSSTFDHFSIALVFRNIGDDATIPQQFPRCTRIKATIRIKHRAFIFQPATFHVIERVLQFLNEFITIIMLTSDDPRRGDNCTVLVGYWQDITGLGFLAALISDAFAPFFATLWLPSRFSSDKFNAPRIETILASKRRCKLPSLLHLRK